MTAMTKLEALKLIAAGVAGLIVIYGGATALVDDDPPATASAPVPNVRSSEELAAVILAAKGGETLILAPGEYTVQIADQRKAGVVLITGPGAKILDLDIQRSKGFRFSGLEFDARAPAYFRYRVEASEDIHFDKLNVHGSLNDNPQDDAMGISFIGSRNVSVTGSEFQQLQKAVAVAACDQVEISGNIIHDIQADGVLVAETRDIAIKANHFYRFSPAPGDHPDAIQFMGTGTKRSSENIVIADNLIERRDGGGIEGIFMRDETGRLPFKNVTITDNLLVETGYQGIAVLGGEGVVIRGNELISRSQELKNWILLEAVKGGEVSANKAIAITVGAGSVGVTEKANILNKPAKGAAVAAVAAWGGRAAKASYGEPPGY